MITMKQVNLGLIGFGNIGTGVVNALNRNGELIAQRIGAQLVLRRIADVDTKRRRAADYDPAIVTPDANAILDDPSIDIVIELVGGLEPARSFVEKGAPVCAGERRLSMCPAPAASVHGNEPCRQNLIARLSARPRVYSVEGYA